MGAVHRLVQRARQVLAERAPEVPSPCISVCRIDPVTQWCEGCFRTLDEVAGWSAMSDADQREVWRMIEQRVLSAGRPGLRIEPVLSQSKRSAMTDSRVEQHQDNS